MVWRDDDILWQHHGLETLLAVDDVFQKYQAPHTIAIIADTLTPAVGRVIRERGMLAQLHCWHHDDLSVGDLAIGELPRAIAAIEDLVGQHPTTLYPPWNRTSEKLEAAAAALGLVVSHEKVSLEQFIRFEGQVGESVVNFHYWHAPDRALLDTALAIAFPTQIMKSTDYCPRAAPFDAYLRDRRGLIGVEVGVDAGAHAEALLRHCDIALLHLVDIWPREYQYGFCEGRLSALGFRPRFRVIPKKSEVAAALFTSASLDFVYVDQARDESSTTSDLHVWWPKLKARGVFGYRNYSKMATPLGASIEAFLVEHKAELDVHRESGEIVLVKRP